jgi:polyisoprenoid-binding protein YceI
MSSAVLTRPAPARTMTGRWVIDEGETAVTIRTRMLGIPVRGRFEGAAGLIDVPDDITRANVSATVRSDSFRARWIRRNHPARILDAAAHPSLSFSATGLRPIMESVVTLDGARPLWWLTGELTVMDITRPLRLALGVVHLRGDARALEFGASATLRRSDFGVTNLRGVVGDTIDVTVRGLAHPERAG